MFLNKKTVSLFLVAVFFIVIDRFLKVFAWLNDSYTPLLGELLKFNFEKNYYIAFSIPIGGIFLNILIAILIAILIVTLLNTIKQKKDIQSFLVFNIILGALSNYFDRLKLGYVIDYIDLKYFTVFNVADAMISVSAILLMIIVYLEEKQESSKL